MRKLLAASPKTTSQRYRRIEAHFLFVCSAESRPKPHLRGTQIWAAGNQTGRQAGGQLWQRSWWKPQRLRNRIGAAVEENGKADALLGAFPQERFARGTLCFKHLGYLETLEVRRRLGPSHRFHYAFSALSYGKSGRRAVEHLVCVAKTPPSRNSRSDNGQASSFKILCRRRSFKVADVTYRRRPTPKVQFIGQIKG